MNPIDIASTLIGKREAPDRAAIQEYLKNGGVNLDPVTTAWCAAFVNSTLSQAGIQGTGSNLARSFLKFGEAVDTPQRGDIAVYSRGDPNSIYGHVGFVDAVNPDGSVNLLGGNQGSAGEVSSKRYGAGNLLGYRRFSQGGTAQPGATRAAAASSRALSPTPMAQTPGIQPGQAAPAIFGDVVAPKTVQTIPVGPSFGDLLAARAQRGEAEAARAAADQQRRAALFGDGLFGPFG